MSISNIILQGLITGIILTLSFGAGFFALVQTSILRGYKKGLLIALGAILSDTLFIGSEKTSHPNFWNGASGGFGISERTHSAGN